MSDPDNEDAIWSNGPIPKDLLERAQAFAKTQSKLSPEEKASTLAAAEARVQAYIDADVWFEFYDPYKSLVATDSPKFVDRQGASLRFHRSADTGKVLKLAISAANELFDRSIWPELTEERWRESVQKAKDEVQSLRALIPLDSISFVDSDGRPATSPSRSDLDPFDVVHIAHRLFLQVNGRNEVIQDSLRRLLCWMCLRQIDNILLGCLFSDAGEGIASSIEAAESLGAALALNSSTLVPPGKIVVQSRAEINDKGREIKNAARYKAQDCIWDDWMCFGRAQYEDNKTKFAEEYAVPKVKEKFLTAAGVPMVISVGQVRDKWLKERRPGRPADE